MSDSIRVYVGTYTGGSSEGIYAYRLDMVSGALTYESHISGVENPSFIALSSQNDYLYAVNENGEGAVTAFAVDQATGTLTRLNQRPSRGGLPCSIYVDASSQCVLVANYGSGTVTVFPIQEDGSIGEDTTFIQHEGSSVDPARQEGPHAHMIITDPANNYAFVPDLGMDRVMIYRLDPDQGKLTPNDPPYAQVRAGSGPRHLTFHPTVKYAYVINEMGNTVTVFTYDADQGAMNEIQMVNTLPIDFDGASGTADIHITPDGKFLYGSNRGHDSLAMFSVDQGTGLLTPIGFEPTRGANPRNFGIDPTGTFLLVANQSTDTVTTFRINHDTGALIEVSIAEVPTAVCLKFVQI